MSAGNTDKRTVDQTTFCAKVINYEHAEVHEGSSFHFGYTTTTAATDDHRTAIAFKTPNTTKWGHLTVTVTASQPAEFFLLEGPTTLDVDKGSDGTILNRNRNSTNASVMLSNETAAEAGKVTTYTEAQVVVADGGANFAVSGTTIEYVVLAGGNGPFRVGGMTRGAAEVILKKNTLYMFLLQNIGNNANIHLINLDWYEHTNL